MSKVQGVFRTPEQKQEVLNGVIESKTTNEMDGAGVPPESDLHVFACHLLAPL